MKRLKGHLAFIENKGFIKKKPGPMTFKDFSLLRVLHYRQKTSTAVPQ